MAGIVSQTTLSTIAEVSTKIATKKEFLSKENAKPVTFEKKNATRFSSCPIFRVSRERKAAIQGARKLLRERLDSNMTTTEDNAAKDASDMGNVVPTTDSDTNVVQLDAVNADIAVSKPVVGALENNPVLQQADLYVARLAVQNAQLTVELRKTSQARVAQAAAFAVEKQQMETQLQQALQSLDRAECDALQERVRGCELEELVNKLTTEKCELWHTVQMSEAVSEMAESAFAAEQKALQEEHRKLQQELTGFSELVNKLKTEKSELWHTVQMSEAVSEMTERSLQLERGKLQQELTCLRKLLSKLKTEGRELWHTVQMSEAVNEMTESAFAAETAELQEQMTMLTEAMAQSALSLSGDLAVATVAVRAHEQLAGEELERNAALLNAQ
eukprot:TRINITY_DN3545_c0_g1_i3.p1 TRINITY_DN3545_c0_g1~~TRINITY_DN3545_c0_g1_i3.p1  ORF type:complete len:388 (+),score=118.73 TRINITY_DN3545_c0_g1_i3:128-1291(+)